MSDVRKVFRRMAALIAGVGILAILIVCLIKFTPTRKRMEPAEYFGKLAENEAAVVIEDHVAQERALIQDGNVYLDYTLVQRELNSRFHWDASEESCSLRRRIRFMRSRRIRPRILWTARALTRAMRSCARPRPVCFYR